jgi:hypothetical protein
MTSELKAIVNQLERNGELNKSDIPILLREIRDLDASEQLAWQQLERLQDKYTEYI